MLHGLALIFDMDGVIVDSTATHTEAWRQYLLRHAIEIEQIEQRMLGKHNAELVRGFFADHPLTDDDVIAHGARKEELYRELMSPMFDAHVVPGITDFIRRHRDLPLGIATNAELPNIEFTLDRAGIRPYIRVVVNGDQVDRPKPAPDIYLRTAELLGVNPADCVVFEDSLTGVDAARSAGMRVVGVTTTLPVLPGVDLSIRDFRDPALPQWLHGSTLSV